MLEAIATQAKPLVVLATPQSPVAVRGFKPHFDGTDWLCKTVTHSVSGSGFTTRIEFETRTEPAEAERELDHDPGEGITGVKAN